MEVLLLSSVQIFKISCVFFSEQSVGEQIVSMVRQYRSSRHQYASGYGSVVTLAQMLQAVCRDI